MDKENWRNRERRIKEGGNDEMVRGLMTETEVEEGEEIGEEVGREGTKKDQQKVKDTDSWRKAMEIPWKGVRN